MKKIFSLAVACVLCLTCFSASALADVYHQHQSNPAGIETIEAIHSGAVDYMTKEYPGKTFKPDPALDTYPAGTTYVYRSAGMFNSDTAADRMNTNFLVYTDKTFASADEALAYLKTLGLTDLADEATGSVVLVSPIDAENGYGAADQTAYYQLQSVMCNINYMSFGADKTISYIADPGYFGGVAYRYLIGIDGGATFLNNYIASTFDYISRIAGMLLVNGQMESIRQVAAPVPVYLVNSADDIVAKYRQANGTDASEETPATLTTYNQTLPLQKVVVAKDAGKDTASYIHDAYYNLFIHAMRIPVVKAGLYTPAAAYNDHNFNQAPYSLCERNPILNGKTPDGINVIEHQEDRFSDIKASDGEYLNTWYEFLPQEVLDGTAASHSIPLILANHGGGDDPVQAVDETGLLTLAGKERFAIVAPRYASDVAGSSVFSPSPYDTNGQALPALVKYMLEQYPQLDPSRVYVTGYSMGGSATIEAISSAPTLFAAAVPMAAATPTMTSSYVPTDAQAAQFTSCDLPILFTTSSFDLPAAMNQAAGTHGDSYLEHINRFLGFNEMKTYTYDFNAYPLVGFPADRIVKTKLNGEYNNTTWYLNNDAGIPMVGVSFTEFLPHGLYPEYGKLAWNFMKHYARNAQTGAIEYNPYVD